MTVAISGGGIEIEEGLAHRERIAEKWSAAILLAMTETAIRQRAIIDHPFRRAFRDRQRLGIVGDVVVGGKS